MVLRIIAFLFGETFGAFFAFILNAVDEVGEKFREDIEKQEFWVEWYYLCHNYLLIYASE